jgi:hypothetical protein
MKAQFREHLKEYVARKIKNDFDKLSTSQQSKWMALFYADEVVRPTNPLLIPEIEEDLTACMVDGSDDCGVDFLARAGNIVLIIQAKFSGARKAGKKRCEDPADFDSFCSVLSRLHTGPGELKMNQKLREAIVDIDWERDDFDLRYITLSQPAGNSLKRVEQGVVHIPEVPDLPDRCTITLMGEEQLNVELRDSVSLREGIPNRVKLRFTANGDDPPFINLANGQRGCFVGRVSGAQLAEIYKTHRSRLFALNIRNYIGDNATNRAIRKTAVSDAEEFFFFNNGISALATRIEPDGQDECAVVCDDFSIINGAQTIRSMSKAQAENPHALRSVQVLVRISETAKRRNVQEQQFLDNVTKYNNTQNAIKLSDFRSNDPIQQDLAEKFASLPARSGRKFLYKNKRSGERDSNRIPISMEEFTKPFTRFSLVLMMSSAERLICSIPATVEGTPNCTLTVGKSLAVSLRPSSVF